MRGTPGVARARWQRFGALGAVVVLALGACGGDDDDAADAAAFCDAYVEANNAASSGEGDPTPAFEAAEAAAPDDIADEVTALIAAAAAAEAEDVPSPEFFDANVAVGEYVDENCDFETIDVTAREYEFEGLPDESRAGTILVKFTNEGAEVHELAMFTVNEGEERSLKELLALPEEEVEAVVTEVNGSAFALPGGTYYTTFDLVAGRTAALCFIPVGFTQDALESGEEPDGAPHFTEGMADEFEVTS
jgi:hypothetical protein